MQTGLVVGTATATVKHPSLTGWKLLVVQPLGPDNSPDGDPIIVGDKLGAGAGQTVIISSDGRGTRVATEPTAMALTRIRGARSRAARRV